MDFRKTWKNQQDMDLEGDGKKDRKDDAYVFSRRQFVPLSEIRNARGRAG